MIPISVCIITKNEAENLQRCLEALKPYPFEIVVTDTGSEDNSLETAGQFTDHVYEFAWINDFSAARNFCVSHATTISSCLWTPTSFSAPLTGTLFRKLWKSIRIASAP